MPMATPVTTASACIWATTADATSAAIAWPRASHTSCLSDAAAPRWAGRGTPSPIPPSVRSSSSAPVFIRDQLQRRLRGGPGDGSKLAWCHSPVAPISPEVTSASCTGSPPAINLEKAVVRYRLTSPAGSYRQHPRGTASPDFKRAVENPSMRPGQLRPGVRQPRELAGTALLALLYGNPWNTR